MTARIHMTLWAGCALVAVLELPHSGAQLGQDIRRFWEHGAVLSAQVESDTSFAAELAVAATGPEVVQLEEVAR